MSKKIENNHQLVTCHSLQERLQCLWKVRDLTMVQAVRSNSAMKFRFLVGISVVMLLSACVAVSLSRATSPQPLPTELDMEANDANFLLNSLPSMATAPDAPVPVIAPKAKKVAKNEPTSEESIMQHDIDSLKKNLKVHLEKETSDHIQLNALKTDKKKAMQVEQSLESKIAAEKIQLSALEGHVLAAHAPAAIPASITTSQTQKVVASVSADKKAHAAMLKALQNAHVPSQVKSKVDSDIKKVQGVLSADAKQQQALAGIEMKISNLEAAEARDKASIAQVNSLRSKLRGAAQILKTNLVKDATKLQTYVAKQDHLAPIVLQNEARDKKLKSLVSAISRKTALSPKSRPVKTRLFETGPVILTELAQSVAELAHHSLPTDLTFTSLAAETVDSIKAEIRSNEASLSKVQSYLKTVDSEERAFRKDLKSTQMQEKPIRAGIKAMADI
jgi:hypothetical protein